MLLTAIPFMKEGLPVEVSLVDNSSSGSRTDTYTFTNQAFGAEAPNRYILVWSNCGGDVNNNFVSGTIGGVPITSVFESPTNCIFGIALVPTGTTGTVVINWDGDGWRGFICLWRLINVNPVPYDTAIDETITSSHEDITIDAPSGGVIICAALNSDYSSGKSYTWTGVTENFDVSQQTYDRVSGASNTYTNSVTNQAVQALMSSTPDYGAILMGVSFGPA